MTDVYQEATAAKAAGKYFARFSVHTILQFLYLATPLGENYSRMGSNRDSTRLILSHGMKEHAQTDTIILNCHLFQVWR